jgi:hypothetical protein
MAVSDQTEESVAITISLIFGISFPILSNFDSDSVDNAS